jgi:hypothetical protein
MLTPDDLIQAFPVGCRVQMTEKGQQYCQKKERGYGTVIGLVYLPFPDLDGQPFFALNVLGDGDLKPHHWVPHFWGRIEE